MRALRSFALVSVVVGLAHVAGCCFPCVDAGRSALPTQQQLRPQAEVPLAAPVR